MKLPPIELMKIEHWSWDIGMRIQAMEAAQEQSGQSGKVDFPPEVGLPMEKGYAPRFPTGIVFSERTAAAEKPTFSDQSVATIQSAIPHNDQTGW
jgi:hypothetical protein